jgi:hypothetical protein
MRHFKADLKNCLKEKRYDHFSNTYNLENVKQNIVNFDINHPFSNVGEYISWRKSIWDVGYLRSLEIWKNLPKKSLENGLGKLTLEAKKSLSGKLGLYNGKTCKKLKTGNWEYVKFNTKQSVFNQLSEKAIESCKERARKYKTPHNNK